MDYAKIKSYPSIAKSDCERLVKRINNGEAWITDIRSIWINDRTILVDGSRKYMDYDLDTEVCVNAEGTYYLVERDDEGNIVDFDPHFYNEAIFAETVTADDLAECGGCIDAPCGDWITTVGWQLESNGATRDSEGYEAWKDLDDDDVIIMHDDGTFEEL